MLRALESRLAALERETDVVLHALEGWSSSQHQFRPYSSAWNALEVIAHLITVERGVLGVPPERRGALTWRSHAMHAAMVLGMRLPIRIGVPVPGANPTEAPELPALRARWSAERVTLRTRLTALERDDQPFARHPLSGAMTARQTLEFYRAHLHHHRFQLARLRRAADFPAG